MVKTSLGRRSSNVRSMRLSETDTRCGNDTARKGEQKRSFIPKPGFASRSRSSSVDRDSRSAVRSASKVSIDHKMNRSRSQINLRTPLVPMTPIYNNINLLPSGSCARPLGSDQRLSSVGAKTSRRDMRPLTDKAFQQEAQRQVTQFFARHPQGSSILEKGSLKPMTTAMFIDLVNVLLKVFDESVMITNQDYITRLPVLMKRFAYRGKIDKSWLQTVNTQHSWPHVLGLLQWLVDANEAYEDFDAVSVFYQTSLEEQPTEESDASLDFKLFLPFLMKAYETFQSKKNCETEIARLEDQLLENIQLSEDISSEEYQVILDEIKELDAELHSPENVAELQELEELKSQNQVLEADIKTMKEHRLRNSKYLAELNEKIDSFRATKEAQEKEIKEVQEEINSTRAEVDQQAVSVAKKDEMINEMADLRRDIAYQNGCFEEYSKIVYQEDIHIVTARQKVNAALLEYNKLVAVNTLDIPQLAGARIDVNVLAEGAIEELNAVDETLKDLRSQLKNIKNQLTLELNSLRDLAVNIQEAQNKENDELAILNKSYAAKEKELEEFKRMVRETTENIIARNEELRKKIESLVQGMPDLKSMESELEKKRKNFEDATHDINLSEKKVLEYSGECKTIHLEFTTKLEAKINSAKKKLKDTVSKFIEPDE